MRDQYLSYDNLIHHSILGNLGYALNASTRLTLNNSIFPIFYSIVYLRFDPPSESIRIACIGPDDVDNDTIINTIWSDVISNFAESKDVNKRLDLDKASILHYNVPAEYNRVEFRADATESWIYANYNGYTLELVTEPTISGVETPIISNRISENYKYIQYVFNHIFTKSGMANITSLASKFKVYKHMHIRVPLVKNYKKFKPQIEVFHPDEIKLDRSTLNRLSDIVIAAEKVRTKRIETKRKNIKGLSVALPFLNNGYLGFFAINEHIAAKYLKLHNKLDNILNQCEEILLQHI